MTVNLKSYLKQRHIWALILSKSKKYLTRWQYCFIITVTAEFVLAQSQTCTQNWFHLCKGRHWCRMWLIFTLPPTPTSSVICHNYVLESLPDDPGLDLEVVVLGSCLSKNKGGCGTGLVSIWSPRLCNTKGAIESDCSQLEPESLEKLLLSRGLADKSLYTISSELLAWELVRLLR